MHRTLFEHLQQRRADGAAGRRLRNYLAGRERMAQWNEALQDAIRHDESLRRLDCALQVRPVDAQR
jgi:hypothetical protein